MARYEHRRADEIEGLTFRPDYQEREFVVVDTVRGHVMSSHTTEGAALRQSEQLNASPYLKRRNKAREHPQAKDRNKTFHNTDRPYTEVSNQIGDAIARFKNQQK
jgi:hypothetical protein